LLKERQSQAQLSKSWCQNRHATMEAPIRYVERDHTWKKCIFICSGLSMCITVDILQYSMPLAFLPSVLEDRGHSTMKIATAIGVYYWTGFLGGLMITCYQVYRVLYERRRANSCEVTDIATVKRHIVYLIVGLLVGSVTLCLQAMNPTWFVHFMCRFVQGFCGSFIFFYTFLLSVALFRDDQQVVAMTFASCALNVAEVFGSFFGAVVFDQWGQRMVFWILGVVSVLTALNLIAVFWSLTAIDVPMVSTKPSLHSTPMVEHRILTRMGTPPPSGFRDAGDADGAGGPAHALQKRLCGAFPPPQPGAMANFKSILASRPLACACLLIFMAAVVKGSVEEMLPFHADHRWGYEPLQIGELFCVVAIAYILAAALCGKIWFWLGTHQIGFAAYWLFMLGVVAWCVFAVVSYFRDSVTLKVALFAYGICLGMTHTPAALLLADVIDHEEGAAKEAVNGVWNTMWEAGGSLGFLLGGLLAEHYHEQMSLLTAYAIACAVAAGCMLAIEAWPTDSMASFAIGHKMMKEDYGGTA